MSAKELAEKIRRAARDLDPNATRAETVNDAYSRMERAIADLEAAAALVEQSEPAPADQAAVETVQLPGGTRIDLSELRNVGRTFPARGQTIGRLSAESPAPAHNAVAEALQSYRCQHSRHDDDGLPLVDLLTPDGDKTIERGREELMLLADHVATGVVLHSPPPPVAAVPAQCCMCGKKGLSTAEGDGGTECELSDGRWVCSRRCWDVACSLIEPQPAPAMAEDIP